MSNSEFFLENMQQCIVTSFLFFVSFLNGTITTKNIYYILNESNKSSSVHPTPPSYETRTNVCIVWILSGWSARLNVVLKVCGWFHHSSRSCGLNGIACSLLNWWLWLGPPVWFRWICSWFLLRCCCWENGCVFCDMLLLQAQWDIHILPGRCSHAFERLHRKASVERLLRLSPVTVVVDVQPSILSVKLICSYANIGLYNGLKWFLSTTAYWKNPDDVAKLELFQVFSSFIVVMSLALLAHTELLVDINAKHWCKEVRSTWK